VPGLPLACLQAAISRLAVFAKDNYTYVEDHIRPVVRLTSLLSVVFPAGCSAGCCQNCRLPTADPTPCPCPAQVRRYIPGPIQKKIMNDCFDARPAEEWFQVRWGGAAGCYWVRLGQGAAGLAKKVMLAGLAGTCLACQC